MDSTSTTSLSNALQAIRYAVGTDVGRRREENQDAYGVIETENYRFFIVADGMGGAKGGGTASTSAIEIVKKKLSEKSTIDVDSITEAIKAANAELFEIGSSDETLAGMGTTFVGIAFVDTKSIIVNVGDSRAYRIRKSSIFQLTSDHTLVNELVKTGAISPDQVENHPVTHMLTRSLGPTPTVEVDCWVAEGGPARYDKYLLCSDGLYNLVEDHEMLRIVNENSLDEAVQKLIDLANERGGTDNITVVLIEVGDEYPVSIMDYPQQEVSIDAKSGQSLENSNGESPFSSELEDHLSNVSAPSDDREGAAELPDGERETASSDNKLKKDYTSKKSVTKWIQMAFVGLVLILIGTQLDRFIDNEKTSNAKKIIFNPLAVAIAPEAVDPTIIASKEIVPVTSTPPIEELRLADLSLSGDQSTDIFPLPLPLGAGTLTARQKASLVERKKVLEQSLSKIKAQLAALDKPISGELIESLAEAEKEIRAKQQAYDKLGLELDIATRKLSVWYGRKQRLNTEDPVDMASEVAVSSSMVKRKKEAFERATWEYLNAVEAWRFNPSDSTLTKKVSALGRQREEAKRKLAEAVREAVEANKAESEQLISDLSQKRDAIKREIAELKKNIEFVKAVTNGDKRTLNSIRKELMAEKAHLEAELADLEQMLGR